MEESARIKKQKELIEYIGIQNERDGYQPAAARIMGMLMVMDKEEYTFDEIVKEMRMSKSSVSTALKNLELRGALEYVTHPGDRKRYFRFIFMEFDEIIDEVGKKIRKSQDVVSQIISLKKDPYSREAMFLKNISKGMDFFINRLDELKTEYRKE
ncbi:MAG: GbsR/MarR family transcriptional regulator [Mangrovibacterium sp.]